MQGFSIKTYNTIHPQGLSQFPSHYSVSEHERNPDAIICRSADLHKETLSQYPNLKIIVRAGVGYNTIPVKECTKRGVIVANTPGANANAVKELVLATMIMIKRNLSQGAHWVKECARKAITAQTPEEQFIRTLEIEKKQFAGNEVKHLTLGVVGLGAIGQQVVNSSLSLGMNVLGYDPYLSVGAALKLSHEFTLVQDLRTLVAKADIVTLHIPYSPKTRHIIHKDILASFKPSATLINLARGELVEKTALYSHLTNNPRFYYVTDFPDLTLSPHERVLAIPHLGASTSESERNCAIMAAQQCIHYLEDGTIKHAINFPDCKLEWSKETKTRLVVGNYNQVNVVARCTSLIGKMGLNIENMINTHKDSIAVTIIDLDQDASQSLLDTMQRVDGVIFLHHILAPIPTTP